MNIRTCSWMDIQKYRQMDRWRIIGSGTDGWEKIRWDKEDEEEEEVEEVEEEEVEEEEEEMKKKKKMEKKKKKKKKKKKRKKKKSKFVMQPIDAFSPTCTPPHPNPPYT